MTDHLNNWAKHTPKPKKARKPGTILEKDVVKAIKDAFKLKHRIALFVTDAGVAGMRQGLSEGARGYSSLPPGFPDLLGVVPGSGRALFIEVKRPGGKPTLDQEAFLAAQLAKGAIAFWADSLDSALKQFKDQCYPGEAA